MNNAESPKISTKDRLSALASMLWLFGLLTFLMGCSCYWIDEGPLPKASELKAYTGEMQRMVYFSPNKGPSLIDIVIYNEKDHLKRGKIPHALRSWEDRLTPYFKHQVTISIDDDKRAWRVEADNLVIISEDEVAQRLSNVATYQKSLGNKLIGAGMLMCLIWLLFLRKCFPISELS